MLLISDSMRTSCYANEINSSTTSLARDTRKRKSFRFALKQETIVNPLAFISTTSHFAKISRFMWKFFPRTSVHRTSACNWHYI